VSGGDKHAAALVATGDQLEEAVRAASLEGQADFEMTDAGHYGLVKRAIGSTVGGVVVVALLNDIQIATDNRPPDTSGLVTPA
jgi:hypothetical protein